MNPSYAAFMEVCHRSFAQDGRQGGDYFRSHEQRFWNTYRICQRLVRPGDSLISVGAGSAYIEHALHKLDGVKVTVVDFPEAIESHRREYEASGFTMVGQDLTQPMQIEERFNFALSCEIVEHIPEDPQKHVNALSAVLAKTGHLVLTTPNLGNLRVLLRLALMRPILPDPSASFGPVSYENEGVHRREYMPQEIFQCYSRAGLKHAGIYFTDNATSKTPKDRLLGVASALVPRFAQSMILVGQKVG
jgi:2-polyprenyl-3-methyl-5-hydroxy-6-metoxy-1,4-benzoquinol methylase